MKKNLVKLSAIFLFTIAVYCAASGYRNYQLFVRSHGASEQNIRLDTVGNFSVMVDPPGRSKFRPGGVLEIFVSRNGIPVDVEGFTKGSGSLKVVDHKGHISLEATFDDLSVTHSSRGKYYSLLIEFDTSRGGPYQIHFEVTEPFKDLEGMLQILSASHFVSGTEVAIYYLQFSLAILTFGLSMILIRMAIAANRVEVTGLRPSPLPHHPACGSTPGGSNQTNG